RTSKAPATPPTSSQPGRTGAAGGWAAGLRWRLSLSGVLTGADMLSPRFPGTSFRLQPLRSTTRVDGQASDEMQPAAEQRARRPRIHAELPLPGFDFQPPPGKAVLPLAPRPVIERQHDPVARIAHTIHEAKRRSGDEPLEQVVLDQHDVAGHARRLAQ